MLQGSNLDSNAKMWRLVADFMNDLGRFFHIHLLKKKLKKKCAGIFYMHFCSLSLSLSVVWTYAQNSFIYGSPSLLVC